ncbi:uncharacterized protein LOC108681558 [Hyalella azteca]|uniref:Uncharacterized protein LOC108681558 n=1 Tax=Hyalella azteca TaxID=294128 RepID=A0A8B7PKZ5_HYAAZ|nr:uncharacterized protein LOC108681558 [Hyalella azteca]
MQRSSALSVVCAVLVVAVGVVNAASYYPFPCNDLDWWVDPLAETMEGKNILSKLGPMHVMLWDPTDAEQTAFVCASLLLDVDAGSFNATAIKSDNSSVSVTGNLTYIMGPPSSYFELTMYEVVPDAVGLFGFSSSGSITLYPEFVSSTELILLSCRNRFLGLTKIQTLYVFTNQDLTALDNTCLMSHVATETEVDVQPVPNLAKCMPPKVESSGDEQ